jgi:hypothetical protein
MIFWVFNIVIKGEKPRVISAGPWINQKEHNKNFFEE